MTRKTTLEKNHLALVEFLLLSKHEVVAIGGLHGLTPMQSLALLALDEPRSMHELRHVFNCDPSNVTGIIDGLERKGLAARGTHAEDRRIKQIQLNKKGVKARQAIVHELAGKRSYILAKLSDAEAETFIGLLQKITT